MRNSETKEIRPDKLAKDFWGLGLAITTEDLTLSKVMAVPFCTGLVFSVIMVHCLINALMSNN